MVAGLRSRGFALTPLSDAEILVVAGVTPAVEPPPALVRLSWSSLASKCKRTAATCRLKGKLLARNLGDEPSPALSRSFLLSDDAPADGGDAVLATREIRALPRGKRQRVRLKATLPPGVTVSRKYVITLGTSDGSSQVLVRGPLR
jgi:hypothetical protein